VALDMVSFSTSYSSMSPRELGATMMYFPPSAQGIVRKDKFMIYIYVYRDTCLR
jgi:hypothetical protein